MPRLESKLTIIMFKFPCLKSNLIWWNFSHSNAQDPTQTVKLDIINCVVNLIKLDNQFGPHKKNYSATATWISCLACRGWGGGAIAVFWLDWLWECQIFDELKLGFSPHTECEFSFCISFLLTHNSNFSTSYYLWELIFHWRGLSE